MVSHGVSPVGEGVEGVEREVYRVDLNHPIHKLYYDFNNQDDHMTPGYV